METGEGGKTVAPETSPSPSAKRVFPCDAFGPCFSVNIPLSTIVEPAVSIAMMEDMHVRHLPLALSAIHISHFTELVLLPHWNVPGVHRARALHPCTVLKPCSCSSSYF